MLACAALLWAPQAAFALDNILVQTDRATVLKLLPKTATVIVGNPFDRRYLASRRTAPFVVTGKSYGTTNLILQDATGAVLGEPVDQRAGRVGDGRAGCSLQRGMGAREPIPAPRAASPP